MAPKLRLSSYQQIDAVATGLALAVAGLVATEGKDLVTSVLPVLVEGRRWLPTAAGMFLVTATLVFFATRGVVRALRMLQLVRRPSDAVTARIPPLLIGSKSQQEPDSLEDAAAQQIIDNVLKPALPGLTRTVDELRIAATKSDTDPIEARLMAMSSRWFSAPVRRSYPDSPLTYVDPIHGTIEFDSRYRVLLTHPLLQRLNEIRQLAFAFPRYPGGTHTRFSHSIGVAHLARAAMKRVLDAGDLYTPKGTERLKIDEKEKNRLVDLATVSGLVHDVGHPPLGHTLDRFFRARFFAGEATSDADKSFFPSVLAHLSESISIIGSISPDDVVRVLDGTRSTGWEVFISQLVSSKLDVDRIDYLQRDAHFTGQREGLLSVDALLSAMRPFETENGVFLTFDSAFLSDVEQFVYARDVMYLRCYEHPKKVVSESLASRLVKKVFEAHLTLSSSLGAFGLLTDSQLFELLDSALAEDSKAQDALRGLFRSDAHSYEETDSASFSKDAVEGWLEVLLGDYLMGSQTLLDKIAETESRIAKTAGVSPEEVVLVLPDPKANEERSVGLDIRILVRSGSGFGAVPLLSEESDDSPSPLLRRRKFVAAEFVEVATDLDVVRKAARKGISLLGIIQAARFRLRLFLHKDAAGRAAAVKAAFRSLGVRGGE